MEDHNSPEAIADRANQEDPIVMYLIIRESLNMSIGKACAQSGHASQMMLLKREEALAKLDFVGAAHGEPAMRELFQKTCTFNEWLQTSFRKVVLKADDKEWAKVKSEISPEDMIIVVDAGLTEIPAGSETFIAIWPMYRSQRPRILKKLQTLK